MGLGDVRPYILSITDHLHFFPSDDFLVLINRNRYIHLLKGALKPVQDHYDFIITDTLSVLSKQTINSLMVSDYIVVIFQTEKLACNALPRFFDTIEGAIQAGNENLIVASILSILTDGRRIDGKELLQLVREEYGYLMFNTVISGSTKFLRLSVYGIFDNPINKLS